MGRKYDFTYSGSDCDVHNDCQGWCGWSKNWSFVKEALVVMCGEFNLKGVLVATNDKAGEFFHDMSDFRQSLTKILKNADIPGRYEPRKWVLENYGNAQSGKKLL